MAQDWRLIDTGLASAARNVAMSRALLEARNAEEIASTLRFARFTRCALLAAGQPAAPVLDAAYCAEHSIPVQRRITGGPAYYVDERQLVWELYLHRREARDASLRALTRRVGNAVAAGLAAFGVDARLRGRCEIEIDGRALGWSGAAVEGDAVAIQGVLLLDAPAAGVLSVLRTPWRGVPAALEREAESRVTCLKDATGRQPDMRAVKNNLCEAFESEFEVEFREADEGLSEQARFESALPGIDSAEWVGHLAGSSEDLALLSATHPTAPLSVGITFERTTRMIRQVWLTSGAVPGPRRSNADFEAAMGDVPLEHLAQRVERFFADRERPAAGLCPADFIAVVNRAIHQPQLAGNR